MSRRKRAFRLPPAPDNLADEVDEEVRFHLEQKVARLVREGMSEDDAWREAHRRFGDVDRVKARMTRERELGMRRLAWWDRMRQDVTYAVRQLTRNAGFATVAVLTLALGIGVTTAIFSVVDGILFRPLPFPESDRLTVVWADRTRAGGPADEWTNFEDFFDLQERSRSFEALAAYADEGPTLTGLGDPEQIQVGLVSHGMLSEVLRVSPALGRALAPEDDRPGAPGTILLADGFWRRAFGADPSVLGRTLTLSGEPVTVIGVLPADFSPPFVSDADGWMPLRQDRAENFCPRANACLHAVGRLAEGVTLAAARAEASDIAGQLEHEYPQQNEGTGFNLVQLRADIVADSRTGLLVLLGAVGFVLLIACVNVATLLMARATTRKAELSVRAALGASRRRIVEQLFTESALLALVGGCLGLVLGYLGTDLLVLIAPAGTPRVEGVEVSGRVLGFALAVTVLAGTVFGLVPSLRMARSDIESGLRRGGRGGGRGQAGVRARGVLVAGQVALALMLLVGAGLLVRSFRNLRATDLGFEPDDVLTLRMSLPSSRYPDADARRDFMGRLEERLAALPGVEALGATSWLPLTGFGSDVDFEIESHAPPPEGESQVVWYRMVTPGFPGAMEMGLTSGRWFTPSDAPEGPLVVVIDAAMGERYFPGEDPLGKRLKLGGGDAPWREIVGVARDARYFGIRGDSRNALYVPYAQVPQGGVWMALRSTREPSSLASEVRRAVADLDASLAVAQIRPMEVLVSDAVGPERFVTMLLGLFAGVALLLAVVGLYGVVSYGVNQRLREMGVRLALGAEGGDIRAMVLRQSLKLVAAGLVLGAAGAVALTRLMDNLLFGVSATDPWTYGATALVLAGVATLAAAAPAVRAARVDPIRVLNAE